MDTTRWEAEQTRFECGRNGRAAAGPEPISRCGCRLTRALRKVNVPAIRNTN